MASRPDFVKPVSRERLKSQDAKTVKSDSGSASTERLSVWARLLACATVAGSFIFFGLSISKKLIDRQERQDTAERMVTQYGAEVIDPRRLSTEMPPSATLDLVYLPDMQRALRDHFSAVAEDRRGQPLATGTELAWEASDGAHGLLKATGRTSQDGGHYFTSAAFDRKDRAIPTQGYTLLLKP